MSAHAPRLPARLCHAPSSRYYYCLSSLCLPPQAAGRDGFGAPAIVMEDGTQRPLVEDEEDGGEGEEGEGGGGGAGGSDSEEEDGSGSSGAGVKLSQRDVMALATYHPQATVLFAVRGGGARGCRGCRG